MERQSARRRPTVMNVAAHGRQSRKGLELPDDWLAWKPFGYAHKVDPIGPVGPLEKVVETEEDLHIFGLVGAVHEAGYATPPRGAEATKNRAHASHQHQSTHPPNRYNNECAGTGRDGGGWGMATGQETPRAAGCEERRSAAIPRAFAMNIDTNTEQAGFEQGGRAPYPSGAVPPQPPLTQQQHPHPSQHWGLPKGGAGHGFHQGEVQGQVQGHPNGGWQQDHHQQQQHQHQHQQQYGAPPSSYFTPRRCPPAPFLPHQFLPPRVQPQYPHVPQHPIPQRPYMQPYQGQCYACCRGPCQCEHTY